MLNAPGQVACLNWVLNAQQLSILSPVSDPSLPPSLPLLCFLSLFSPSPLKELWLVRGTDKGLWLGETSWPPIKMSQRGTYRQGKEILERWLLSYGFSQCLAERPSQGFDNSVLRDLVSGRLKEPLCTHNSFNSSFPNHSFALTSFPYLWLENDSSFIPFCSQSPPRKGTMHHDLAVLTSVTLIPWRAGRINMILVTRLPAFPFPSSSFSRQPLPRDRVISLIQVAQGALQVLTHMSPGSPVGQLGASKKLHHRGPAGAVAIFR